MRPSWIKWGTVIVIGGLISGLLWFRCSETKEITSQVDFNQHVRPILNEKCLGCHGGVRKSGGFSLLFEKEAFGPTESEQPAIVRGDPENSSLIQLLYEEDPEYRMPQDHPPLPDYEKEILKKWIANGAAWDKPWSFKIPEKVNIPEVKLETWVSNPLDHFILNKLEDLKLAPNEDATCYALIRRMWLDVTGIPPDRDDVLQYCENPTPETYVSLVDKALNSTFYGEHMAAMWLDLARYADTKGYEKDAHREIWKYRDWLIKAFNRDMPYDEFTIHQLAGDLIPDPTPESIIATAFHRNTMTNEEGGTDDEEFRVAAVIDRVNTTWDIWHGLSFSCIQCHAHPYDPFVEEDYYRMYAFFNQTADSDKGNEFPTVKVYQEEDQLQIDEIKTWIKSLTVHSPEWKIAQDSLQSFKASSVPVMQELEPEYHRQTYMFIKGNFLDKGKEVLPGTPASMHTFKEEWPKNRLGLAYWLTDKANPFTARVMVNRIWARIFGRGIVETVEDFGSTGIKPSHPQLLDHLAYQFMYEFNWSIKKLITYLVTSSTYKQDSKLLAEHIDKDPQNYYYARAPRVRLTAEQIRDQALKFSGLMSNRMYGPSVMPYQPEGVWKSVYNSRSWEQSEGEDQYRRAVYTYWKRTSPYPSLIMFDSPSREFCVNRRIATNTPLQSLVTLNDKTYIEVSNALAAKMKERGSNLEEYIHFGFNMILFRDATDEEMSILKHLYEQVKGKYGTEFDSELSVVANALINLDEVITKS